MSLDAFGLFTVEAAVAAGAVNRDNSLDGIDTVPLQSGVFGYVRAGAAAARLFRLDKSSAAVADGLTVVAPLTGPGRWLLFATPSGGPGDIISVDTVAVASASRLVDYNAAGLSDGALAWVESVGALWVLRLNSAHTADNITVVAATGLVGAQWVRLLSDYRSWQYQAVWHIDSAAGNDENDGLALGTALRTFAELNRRWQNDQAQLQSNTDVFIHADLDATADARTWVRVKLASSRTLRIMGVITVLASGNLTSQTPTSPATNVQQSITDAGIPNWAAYLNQRIRLGAGNSVAWIAKVFGPTEARIVRPYTYVTTPGAQSRAAYTITGTDAYAVEQLPNVLDLRIEVEDQDPFNPQVWRVVVQDVRIVAGSFNGWSIGPDCKVTFCGVKLEAGVVRGYGESTWIDCCFSTTFPGTPIQLRRATFDVISSTFLGGGVEVGVGGYLVQSLGGNTSELLCQGGSLAVSAGGLVTGVSGSRFGIFDSTASGVRVATGGAMHNLATVYGDGNASYGWEQQQTAANSTYINVGAKPTVTGALGDVLYFGFASTWAQFVADGLDYTPLNGGGALRYRSWRRLIGTLELDDGSVASLTYVPQGTVTVNNYVVDSNRRILVEVSASFVGTVADNAIFKIVAVLQTAGEVDVSVGGDSCSAGVMGSVSLSEAYLPPAGDVVTAIKLYARSTGGNGFSWDKADGDHPSTLRMWVAEVGAP